MASPTANPLCTGQFGPHSFQLGLRPHVLFGGTSFSNHLFVGPINQRTNRQNAGRNRKRLAVAQTRYPTHNHHLPPHPTPPPSPPTSPPPTSITRHLPPLTSPPTSHLSPSRCPLASGWATSRWETSPRSSPPAAAPPARRWTATSDSSRANTSKTADPSHVRLSGKGKHRQRSCSSLHE